MILDERTYAIHPAHVQDYLDLYRVEGMGIQTAHLGVPLGWFVTDIGVVNEVVHIWRYESLAEREMRRAALEADPAWQAFRRKAACYVQTMNSRILRPTSFSPMR